MPELYECSNCFHTGPLDLHGGCERCSSLAVISVAKIFIPQLPSPALTVGPGSPFSDAVRVAPPPMAPMTMSCNNCRVPLSGDHPVHNVNGFAICDLCMDLLMAAARRAWFVTAQLEYETQQAWRRMMLRGD